MKKTIRRTQERNFAPHHMLLHAARHACESARTERAGSFYAELGAMTFSALALEAMCNSIGSAVIADWLDFEGSAPTAKMRLLAERLKAPYNRDKEPWATARWLMRFRNSVAHAKPEFVRSDLLMDEQEHEARLFDSPLSKLEKQISLVNAERALASVEAIKRLLIDHIPVEQRFGLELDEWSGTSSTHETKGV